MFSDCYRSLISLDGHFLCLAAKKIYLLILLLGLLSCQPQAEGSIEAPPDEVGLGLSGLNYTDMPIGDMYVNGSWGGGVSSHNGCCGFAGGVTLPYPWRPGIKVTVKWSDDELYRKDPNALYTQEVEVPRYDMIYSGYLWVAFFPGHKIKVYASGVGPGYPGFPGGLKMPATYCEESEDCRSWRDSGLPPREGYY